eukprot:657693-Hanusia_phi.AAC.2
MLVLTYPGRRYEYLQTLEASIRQGKEPILGHDPQGAMLVTSQAPHTLPAGRWPDMAPRVQQDFDGSIRLSLQSKLITAALQLNLFFTLRVRHFVEYSIKSPLPQAVGFCVVEFASAHPLMSDLATNS